MRSIYSSTKLIIILTKPEHLKSASSRLMVAERFRTIIINMKKFDYYDKSDIKLFDGMLNMVSSWAYAALVIAKIAMFGIICFNPIFTVLIKNIFVLEFCSMLILFNINYHNQVYEHLSTLYDVIQA